MIIGMLSFMVVACEEADSIHKDFIVEGGLVYPAKASAAKAHPGRNRVEISWLRGTDPSVTGARIYWNNYTDSITVAISPDADTVRTLIDQLEEKPYVFHIVTFDEDNNASIPVELLTAAYGEKYQESLLSRPLNLVVSSLNDTLTLEWGSADIANGAYATQVLYTDNEGKSRVELVDAALGSSTLSGLAPGSSLRYRTIYLPDTLSIDTFYTGYLESGHFSFDKSEWTIVDFSSEHSGAANTVFNAIDGTDATRWHSLSGGSAYPHHITIDLGGERNITRFGVWRTTYENGGDDRAPDKIQFLVSMDNQTWTDLGIFDFNRFLNGEQFFDLPEAVAARYFKLVGVAGPDDTNFVLGEISAYGL